MATNPNPTMVDVAREAGVALKTVSRFVNGESNINPVLAGRIADAIAALGYRRNMAAASIRPGRSSKTIGLIISDLSNPYYSVLARAIESAARKHGYLLISASSDERGDQHDQLVDRLMEQRVDALIVVPPRDPGRDWSSVAPPTPPIVFVDRPVEHPGADTVLADNFGGARDATSALVAHGARRIAFVGDALSIYTMGERHAGYLAAIQQAGLASGPSVFTAHASDEAASAVERLLESQQIDAVFAANNRATVGAMTAFQTLGRRVPIVGFDDFEAAKLSVPAISVVRQDVLAMGTLATSLALDRLSSADMAPQTHVLPTELVLRGSEA